LAAVEFTASMARAIAGEAAILGETLQSRLGELPPGGNRAVHQLKALLWQLTGHDLMAIAHVGAYATGAIEAAELPPEERGIAVAALEAEALSEPAAMVVPAFSRAWEAAGRGLAHVRLARAALALERWRRDHGRWPEGLAEAAGEPEAMDPIWRDPFTGEPLQYRREGQACLLYTVERNGVDDWGPDAAGTGRLRSDDRGYRLVAPGR
jgi:hypothetical protein